MATRVTRAERAEAIEVLRCRIEAGHKSSSGRTLVYVSHKHTSSSGRSRVARFYLSVDGEMDGITWLMAKALGWSWSDRWDGITIQGCGMDMFFHAMDCVARTVKAEGVESANDFDIREV